MALVKLAGNEAIGVRAFVPARGAWSADVPLASAVALEGAVTLEIGALTFEGTIVPERSGTFQEKSTYHIVAGAAGWQKTVVEKHFHNDAGLKASAVANATAVEVGETLVSAPATILGADFQRLPERAGRVLSRLYSQGWYVDFDGLTRVGVPTPSEISGSYDLINFDPQSGIAEIATDDPPLIKLGSILRGRLDPPRRVVGYDISVGALARFYAWTVAA